MGKIVRKPAGLLAGIVAVQAAGLLLAAPAFAPGTSRELVRGGMPALWPLPSRTVDRRLQAGPGWPRQAFPIVGSARQGEDQGEYGADRGGRMHEGQDLFAPAGTRLHALSDGEVVEKGDNGGRGHYIAVHSPSLERTWLYLHMERPSPLEVGDRVRGGQRVGAVGCSGSCFGDHLHIELRKGSSTTGAPTDPRPLLARLRRG